jgi:DNA-binding NtrC family response regulator
MSSNEKTSLPPPRSSGSSFAPQRSIQFEPLRHGRDIAELLRALTKAAAELRQSGSPESALRENFAQAMAGLGAEKGLLVHVRGQHPVDIDILHSIGLTPENESACIGLRSSPGISPSVIRQCIADGRPRLIQNSERMDLDATASLRGRPYSVMCAPVVDSPTGAVLAVLYFQNEAKAAFLPEDVEWLTAYAAALGMTLSLHLSRQQHINELETAWRGAQADEELDIVGGSAATRRLGAVLNRFLPSTACAEAPPILVTGESGTGKELVAQYLHRNSPARRRGQFVTFNCAGLRGELAEARLFGHAKGAFTGAVGESQGLFRAAHKGVLFLDEVGEMPLEGQALLLRALETRRVQAVGDTKEVPVDVQLVLATNRDLEQEVAAKRFREDLYYRICALRVDLLPLRDPTRIADIRPLVAFYLAKHERALKKKTMGLTPRAFSAMLRFAWPGNVRQLSNVCLSLVTHAEPGAGIDIEDIHRHTRAVLFGPKNPHPEAFLEDETVTWNDAFVAFRKKVILDRLQRHGGNVQAAADSLGLSVATFYRHWADAKKDP